MKIYEPKYDINNQFHFATSETSYSLDPQQQHTNDSSNAENS